MKLYYSAGSCSTSCHIALEESGLPHEAIEIDWEKENDPNLLLVAKLNPLGTLPILVLPDGKILSQNISILTHIADQAPAKKLLPSFGTTERAEAMNWLSFVASDLHKSVGMLFGVSSYSPDQAKQAEFREWALGGANKTLEFLDKNLAGKDYLMGAQFTVADGYAFIVASWTKWLNIPLTGYPNLSAYMARVLERPAVQKVFKLEGLFD